MFGHYTAVAALILVIVTSGCSTSNNVVDNGVFQKRKYRKGFHFNGLGQSKAPTPASVDALPGRTQLETEKRDDILTILPDMVSAESSRQLEQKKLLHAHHCNDLQFDARVPEGFMKSTSTAAIQIRSDNELRQHHAEHANAFSDKEDRKDGSLNSLISAIFGVLAWFMTLPAFFWPPSLLVGLIFAIVAVIVAFPIRNRYDLDTSGFKLGGAYIIVFLTVFILLLALGLFGFV
ncbi:MAG: hypothetical protein Kow0075_04380 [Salibacteraceae bacterium]